MATGITDEQTPVSVSNNSQTKDCVSDSHDLTNPSQEASSKGKYCQLNDWLTTFLGSLNAHNTARVVNRKKAGFSPKSHGNHKLGDPHMHQ